MSLINQNQYSGSSSGNVTLTFHHKGLVQGLAVKAAAPCSLTIRQNGNSATDYVWNVPANTRVVHLALFPVEPGSTLNILNGSGTNIEYETNYL